MIDKSIRYSTLSIDSSHIIQKELLSGERLLWSGRPRQGIAFHSRDVFMIPFSIFWCGFAIFWTFKATSIGAPPFFLIFGLGFVCVGLYFVFGRFIQDYIIRRKTVYGLTDARILIITGLGKLLTLDLKQLNEISLSENKDKTGTITFGSLQSDNALAFIPDWSGKMSRGIPKFEMIENVRQVYDMLNRAKNEQKR
jgi:hypothetical protein